MPLDLSVRKKQNGIDKSVFYVLISAFGAGTAFSTKKNDGKIRLFSTKKNDKEIRLASHFRWKNTVEKIRLDWLRRGCWLRCGIFDGEIQFEKIIFDKEKQFYSMERYGLIHCVFLIGVYGYGYSLGGIYGGRYGIFDFVFVEMLFDMMFEGEWIGSV